MDHVLLFTSRYKCTINRERNTIPKHSHVFHILYSSHIRIYSICESENIVSVYLRYFQCSCVFDTAFVRDVHFKVL